LITWSGVLIFIDSISTIIKIQAGIMSKNNILIIGSSNTDMVIKTKKIPVPGETILGGTFLMNQGGKGANQAVAAARLGGKVTFITKCGIDLFGSQAIESFIQEGIDTRHIAKDNELPSGIALITVDSAGENSIVVAPGSNGNLLQEDIPANIFKTGKYSILLMQLEIPIRIVEYCAIAASVQGIKVIINPAPAQRLSDDLLRHTWLLTPNETEAEILSGVKIEDISSVEAASLSLQKMGVKNIIITMGAAGAYVKSDGFMGMISGEAVKALDTTAAGDVFNGALAVALAEGKEFEKAVAFANKAAALSVTRMGAQSSAPYRKEIDN
jgi:ribokinase